ncbi:hypothetical protein TEA_004770 [Camellia sinensis var. sinensis]|uniref:Protein kinase domain-containing protein n=1 Tax=Camellia sinensis var. sinensis TaxID=542762 RepID=A0A4S4D315_CAMSN|nr:hypothetical protein TEA_004770 [Camellia sinensis var. sinensis]
MSPSHNLSAIAAEFNLSQQLLKDFNPNSDFSGGTGLVFIPGKGITGGFIAGITVAGVAGAMLLAIGFYVGFYRRNKVVKGSLLREAFDRHAHGQGPESTLENTSESGPLVGGVSLGLTGITVDKSVEFSYEELAKATDDFSLANKIGQGGFGSVYYAELRGELLRTLQEHHGSQDLSRWPSSSDSSKRYQTGPESTLENPSKSGPLVGGVSLGLTGITVDKSVEFLYEELAKATDDFSLANKIGQGGFGSVYYAELRGEKAAIKKMDMQASKEFLAELKVLTHVHHLNLVRLIGYCVEGSLFLVYEFIENGNLSQHLRGLGRDPLPWSTRVQIALDSARGLEYIHEHTVPVYIHRDIKSANILIDKNFHAKVADFGLAKLTEVGSTSLHTRLVVVIRKEFRLDSGQKCQGVSREQIGEADSFPQCFGMTGVIQKEFIMDSCRDCQGSVCHVLRQANFDRPVRVCFSSDFDAVCCIELVTMSTSNGYSQNLNVITLKNISFREFSLFRNYRRPSVSKALLVVSYECRVLTGCGYAYQYGGTGTGYGKRGSGTFGSFGYNVVRRWYAQYGDVSPKIDVYAFGVVLYELISAKEAIVKTNEVVTESTGLVALFEDTLKQPDPKQDLQKLVDPRLGDDYPLDSVCKIAHLARACTQENPQLRPSMRSIVVALMTLSSSTEDWDVGSFYENQGLVNLMSGR